MKIQEASKDIREGGILFPCPKTSYIEANTQKDEETGISARQNRDELANTQKDEETGMKKLELCYLEKPVF